MMRLRKKPRQRSRSGLNQDAGTGAPMQREDEAHEPQASAFRISIFVFFCILILAAFFNFLRLFIGPFFVALLLAYLSNPAFVKLEKWGIKRPIAITAMLLASSLAGFLTVWFVLPLMILQFEIFFGLLPDALETLKSEWLPKIQKIVHSYFGKSNTGLQVANISDFLPASSLKPGEFVWSGLGAGTQIVGTIALFILATPTFCFFIMKDYKKMTDALRSLIPRDMRETVLNFTSDVDYTVRSVLSGQILVVALLSLLYSTIFFLVGLPGGLAVGLLTGMSRIIPYLDLVVGGTLTFLILVTNNSPMDVITGVVLGFLAVQLIDGLFLTPRIVGQFAGLHPVVIIIAVLSFGDIFGFYGILLAIPVTAVGRVVMTNLLRSYMTSDFYTSQKSSSFIKASPLVENNEKEKTTS